MSNTTTDEAAQDMGIKFFNRRHKLGLSRRRLSNLTAISPANLAKIESGGNPTVDTLKKLATATNTTFVISPDVNGSEATHATVHLP